MRNDNHKMILHHYPYLVLYKKKFKWRDNLSDDLFSVWLFRPLLPTVGDWKWCFWTPLTEICQLDTCFVLSRSIHIFRKHVQGSGRRFWSKFRSNLSVHNLCWSWSLNFIFFNFNLTSTSKLKWGWSWSWGWMKMKLKGLSYIIVNVIYCSYNPIKFLCP